VYYVQAKSSNVLFSGKGVLVSSRPPDTKFSVGVNVLEVAYHLGWHIKDARPRDLFWPKNPWETDNITIASSEPFVKLECRPHNGGACCGFKRLCWRKSSVFPCWDCLPNNAVFILKAAQSNVAQKDEGSLGRARGPVGIPLSNQLKNEYDNSANAYANQTSRPSSNYAGPLGYLLIAGVCVAFSWTFIGWALNYGMQKPDEPFYKHISALVLLLIAIALLYQGVSELSAFFDRRTEDIRIRSVIKGNQLSRRFGPLPIAAEINARTVFRDESNDQAELLAIGLAAMVIAPAGLSGVAANVDARDVVEMANLGAAQPAEKFLRAIRASAFAGIGEAVIDPLHCERGV